MLIRINLNTGYKVEHILEESELSNEYDISVAIDCHTVEYEFNLEINGPRQGYKSVT